MTLMVSPVMPGAAPLSCYARDLHGAGQAIALADLAAKTIARCFAFPDVETEP